MLFSFIFALAFTGGVATAQVATPNEEDLHDWGYKFDLAPNVKLHEIDYFKNYTPSTVTSDREIKSIGKGMRTALNPGSQCFNRAEVWAYEISGNYKSKYGRELNMVKVFRFFSDQFRAANRYDWWFHVAPAFFVEPMGNSRTFSRDQLFMLDNRAYAGAVRFSDWDRYFFNMAGSKVVSTGCRHVRTYFEYTQLRESKTEDCFDLVVPMHIYTPDDFAAVEKYGKPYPEMKWDNDNLIEAYQQARMGRVREF